MPIGFTQTAERLTGYGKVRDHLEPESALPSADNLSAALTAQLSALSRTPANDGLPQDSIADDLSELVAQLRAMSFARSDVANVADTALDQTPALNKLANGLRLTNDEVSQSANALNDVASQLAELQSENPITVSDLTEGYLQAIENAASTKQQSILLKQLSKLGDSTQADSESMRVLRLIADQDASLTQFQSKKLSEIADVLRATAATNDAMGKGIHAVTVANEEQALMQRHQHESNSRLSEEAIAIADAQLTHDRQKSDEQDKQREADKREEEKAKSKAKREEKEKEKRDGSNDGGDSEEKTSFLTKVMTGDIAGLREEALGAVLGTVGFEGAAGELSDFIEDLGDKRQEAAAAASDEGESDLSDPDTPTSAQRGSADNEPLGEAEQGHIREAVKKAVTSLRGDAIAAALGAVGLEGASDEVEKYLEDKSARKKEPSGTQLALPAPTRSPLSGRLASALNSTESVVDVETSVIPSVGSSMSSTAHIDGLNTAQPKSEGLDLFAPKDRTQERTLAALEQLVTNTASSAKTVPNHAQNVTNTTNATTLTNNDNRRTLTGSRSIANYNSASMSMLPSTSPRVARQGGGMLALPPKGSHGSSLGSQKRTRGSLSSASTIAVGTTDRKKDLMAQPTPQQRRGSQRKNNSAVSKKAASLSPMMQVASNPLAGKDGEALVASTLKLNDGEMDVIGQEMILIKDMRKTLQRVERALPNDGIMGGMGDLFGAGDMLDDFLGGRRRKRDRMGNKDVDRGRRGRRGGTRGGRVRGAIGSMAATVKTAISGVVGGIANMATGGGGGSMLDMAGDFFDFGGSDRRENQGRSRTGGRTGGLKSRIGGAFSKGKGFLGGIAAKGAGLLGGAGGLLGSAGSLSGVAGGLAGGAGGLLKGAGSLAKGVLGKVPLLAPLMAAYDGFNGWNNAGTNFNLEEGQEASTGQKMSSALGSIASGLTFGLLDEGSASRGIHSAGSAIGGLGNSVMNRLTFGLWGGDEEEDGKDTKSAASKIAKASSAALTPTGTESMSADNSNRAVAGALSGTAAMTGLSLAKDEDKYGDLSSKVAKARERAERSKQQYASNIKAQGLEAGSTVKYKPHADGDNTGGGYSTFDSPSLSGRLEGAAGLPSASVKMAEDTPSFFGRMKEAASNALAFTPMGLAYNGLSSLTGSSPMGSTGATSATSKSADTPSFFGRMKDAASSALAVTPMGLAYNGLSSLTGSSPTSSTGTTVATGKDAAAPSFFDRMKDAASNALAFTPMGLAYNGLSSLTGSSPMGSIGATAATGKGAAAPSLFDRMKDVASNTVTSTPMGLAYKAMSGLLMDTDPTDKTSSATIASKDGTFFNPTLSSGGNADQLFMGDSYAAKGGLSSSTAIAGRAPALNMGKAGNQGIDASINSAIAAVRRVMGISEESPLSSKSSSLTSLSNLTGLGIGKAKGTMASRSMSSASLSELLNSEGQLSSKLALGTASGGLLNALVEMPPSLRDETLGSDTLLSSNVKAQLSGSAVGSQSSRSNRNRGEVVSASRPAPQARRAAPRAPAPSNSGRAGSFHVDDTGIAIMNSILFD